MKEVYQIYVTNAWGSNSSRENLGIFSSIENALKHLVKDIEMVESIADNNTRVFIDLSTIDKVDSEAQVFDSDNDVYMEMIVQLLPKKTIKELSKKFEKIERLSK